MMDKMKYETTREKAYYQLGYCTGYGEMGKEILGYIEGELDVDELPEYIKFVRERNNKMLTKLQKRLEIKTLDGSMADEELLEPKDKNEHN